MNNSDIHIYNRKTRTYDVEKVAGKGAIKYMYGTGFGRLGLELLIKRKLYSHITGVICDSRLSCKMIKKFVENFDIDMDECSQAADEFNSFNSFFTRKLKLQSRVFSNNVELLPCPGDGRLRAWENIDTDRVVQIKSLSYSLKELICDDKLAEKYNKGTCLLLRLAPVDYHRFHFIDEGVCSETKKIKGAYYSVNPAALETIAKVFCQNKREYSIVKSNNFGDVLYIEVGATSVGSIVQTYTPEVPLRRGEEKGYFKFGGSTIIVFLENGAAYIDRDILEQTQKGYETRVYAGEIIGRQKIPK